MTSDPSIAEEQDRDAVQRLLSRAEELREELDNDDDE